MVLFWWSVLTNVEKLATSFIIKPRNGSAGSSLVYPMAILAILSGTCWIKISPSLGIVKNQNMAMQLMYQSSIKEGSNSLPPRKRQEETGSRNEISLGLVDQTAFPVFVILFTKGI